jgi:hypothetical protein
MNKQEAGRLGGLATVRRHNPNYMHELAKKGAKRLWELYGLVPYDLNKFKLVKKEDIKW